MSEDAKLLSRPINFAVVQLPEREYPGVVVQGDTLNTMVRRLELMSHLQKTNKVDELKSEIEDLMEQLNEALTHYEKICADRGITLPYPKHV